MVIAVRRWRPNMNRTLRISSVVLAVLYTLSFGSYQWFKRHSGSTSELFFFDCCTLAGYILLAIFWGRARRGIPLVGAISISIAGVLPFLTGLFQTFLSPSSVTDSPAVVQDSRWLELAFVAAMCLVFSWGVWMAWRPLPVRRVRSIAFLIVLGGIMVLSSLFLMTTISDSGTASSGDGWRILDRQDLWITGHASVGQSAIWGGTIKWLQPIFPATGYAVYTLTIIATFALLMIVFSFRFSATRLATSKTFARLTAFLSLASVWIITDIHWGWHFDFVDYPVSAAAAALIWFAMMLAASLGAWYISRGNLSPQLTSWLRLIQLPMIAFNLVLMRAYFEPGSFVPLHGLATLLVGLPILSWACQQILLTSYTEQEVNIAAESPHREELSPELTTAGR